MTIIIHPDPVPLRVDEHGDIRIGQSRVLLDVIVAGFQQGRSPDQIAAGFPTITRADVYAVLAYYLRHQTELDEYLRQRDQEGEEVRQRIEAATADRLAKLKTRRKAGDAGPADG